jgi:SAM-dependent methyltransferase
VEFRWGKIQDLRTAPSAIQEYFSRHPIKSPTDYLDFEDHLHRLRREKPLVRNESIDIILSNCVLNLVRQEDKKELFHEMHRVLKKGGRVAISDIVSDEPIPETLRNDPELWSGCISGAFEEKEFLKAFEEAGFYGIKIEKLDETPWKIVQGIEFRSLTLTALKGKEGPCWERNQAVIYKGPWKEVQDDDHHILLRGVRTAVCDKTFQIFSKEPYRDDIILLNPAKDIPLSKAKPFDCSQNPERDVKVMKVKNDRQKTSASSTCLDGGCC